MMTSAAYMIGMGMGRQNALQHPSFLVQMLAHPFGGILAVAAVDDIGMFAVRNIKTNSGGCVHIIGMGSGLDQFVHDVTFLCFGYHSAGGQICQRKIGLFKRRKVWYTI